MAGSAACSTAENLTAAQRLDQAVDQLDKERSLSFELDLDADAATLKSLDADAGEEMPDQVAEFLAGTRISVSVQSKKPLEESSDKDITGMAIKVSGPDGNLLEYRRVGDWAYLRADAQVIGKATGGSLPTADDLPDSATALKHVLNGEWVKASTGGPQPGPGSVSPKADENRQQRVMKGLRGIIAREVEFKDAGRRDGADHITATAPFRTLLTELFDELRPLAGDLPPGSTLPTAKDLKGAPNEKVTADFSLKNGSLTEVSVDLARLAKTPQGSTFALVLRVGKGEQATAPASATQVDPDALMQELFGGLAPGTA